MRLLQGVLALLYLLLDLAWCGMAQDCSNQTQQLCLSYLSDGGLDIEHIDDDLPTWNETLIMLRVRCSHFESFSLCMTGVTESCPRQERGKYQGWIEAYNYLCTLSNLTAVTDYIECFVSYQTLIDYRCKRVFQSKVNSLLNGSHSVTVDKLDSYCKLADAYFLCLNKTLTDNCGVESAKWQWDWDRKLSRHMPTLQNCPGWSSAEQTSDDNSTSAWTIALIIVLVLITVIMVTAILLLLVFFLKKRKRSSRLRHVRREMHNVPAPPPPYSAVIYASAESGAEPQAHLVDSSVVLNPSDLGSQSVAMPPPTDVVLPPPYMGEQPPVPEYESIASETKRDEESKYNDKQSNIGSGDTQTEKKAETRTETQQNDAKQNE